MGTVLINTLLFRRSWGVLVLRKDGVLLNVDAHERKKNEKKKKRKKKEGWELVETFCSCYVAYGIF